MLVNKKFGRFKQWAGERMGGEVKTNATDDFKVLEQEMTLRHDGMDRLQKSMTAYIRAISKRNEGEDKEKPLAVGYLGSTMVNHGENFECDSEFGQCLTTLGRTNERIARIQEQYVSNATSSWLESIDRSLAQMKDYQAARKKLDTRRLAYDTSLAKMQKAKREDFRVEEDLRSQKVKYEEANEEVYRRMGDIKEAEADSVADLTAFLEAELSYHEKCRDVLLQLKDTWPASTSPRQPGPSNRRPGRARSGTTHSIPEHYEEPEMPSPDRPVIKPTRTVSAYRSESPPEDSYPDRPQQRIPVQRSSTFDSPAHLQQQQQQQTSDNASSIRNARSQLRVVSKGLDGYSDGADDTSPDRYLSSSGDRSPAPSSRGTSSRPPSSAASYAGSAAKKGPPPPPPSRATKPPPPPPPVRRPSAAVNM